MDEVDLLRVGTGTGGCFMMIGSAGGSDVPWSFSFTSFIAIENSNLSIFPSLFISARALGDKETESHPHALTYCSSRVDYSEKLQLLESVWVCVCVWVCVFTRSQPTLRQEALTGGKTSLPAPLQKETKREEIKKHEKIEIVISKGCVVMFKLWNQCANRKITVGMMC